MMTKKQFDQMIRKDYLFNSTPDLSAYSDENTSHEMLYEMLGRITCNFQDLEDEITKKIIVMLKVKRDVGDILTSELSFKNKVSLFASLYKYLKVDYHFNSIPGYEDEFVDILIKCTATCEELRNQILHSTFESDYLTNTIVRKKTTSKTRNGLRRVRQKVSIPYLLHVGDYIIYIAVEIDELFIDFQKKTTKIKKQRREKINLISKSIFE